MPRYKILFSGPLSIQLVRWIEHLIPLLRDAPTDTTITVEISTPDTLDEDPAADTDRPAPP